MSILKRPYAGLWGPNKTKIVQHSPDALVYLNGDTSLPACSVCRRNVEIQPHVTGISVEAGVDPGAHSASINLTFPKKVGDDIFRDGATSLRPALEVHIYMRGYFPVSGLPMNALDNPSDASLKDIDFQAIPQYPYYQVFHGVVTNVSMEYSGGFYSASLSCNSMLHFWGFQNLSTNAAVFGARPSNSRLRTDLRGNYYTGMSPMGIIYTLYKDTIGSADGQDLVSFALGSTTNFDNKSLAEDESLFSLAIRYWERRFRQGPYKLRMHGASGQLFSTAQQAFLGRLGQTRSSGQREKLYKKFIREANSTDGATLAKNPFRSFFGAQYSSDPRLMRNQDILFLLGNSGNNEFGVSHEFFEVIVKDLGQLGTVNLFEGTYETKLNLAEMAAKVSGFEFFQDVDGDLVFKPPLYNLDTRSSRAYNLNPEDIMSISFTEGEPEATYITCRNGPFRNQKGIIDENEWGIKGTYVDYRLVGQFGFRPTSIETSYYNNPKSAYYAAVARLDVVNSNINSCSATIPLRTELRPGYPVYIPHIDCYYYITSLSHSFQFGGQCTTSLTLTARRRKFHGPRAMGSENKSGTDRVDLKATSRPREILRELDSEGNPRITGFPNVVMALDNENLDPFAFFLGDDQTNFGDAKNIDNLIVLLERLKYLKVSPDDSNKLKVEASGDILTKDDLYLQGQAYTFITQELDRIRARKGNTGPLDQQLKDKRVTTKFKREINGKLGEVTEAVDFSLLLELYNTARGDYLGIMGLDRNYLNSTSGLLNLLGNKKTSFAQGVTGYYRYFSSAHPNEDMQGPKSTKELQVTSTLDNQSSVIAPVVLTRTTEPLPNYLSTEEKRVFIEKSDGSESIKRGLPIDRTVVKGGSFDKVVPTHEILTLSFQKATTKVTKNVLRLKTVSGNVPGLESPTKILEKNLISLIGSTIREASENASKASIAGKSLNGRGNFYIVTVPEETTLTGSNIKEVIIKIQNLQRTKSRGKWTVLFKAALAKAKSTNDPSPIDDLNAEYQNDVQQVSQFSALRNPAKANFISVVVTQDVPIQTPVFPVSDGEGYEVVGSYQYGRGLRIEPGGNYQTLMASDPIYYATPKLRKALEAAIDDLLATDKVKGPEDFGKLTGVQLAQLTETVHQESKDRANKLTLEILNIDPSELGTGSTEDRINVIRNGLRNFIQGQNASVFKLPVANAAIALSEIKPVRVEESCTFCQSATADVHLDAFATDQFLLVDTEDIQERASQALADTMLNKEPDWRLRQQALRGETQNQGRNSLWNSVTGTGGLIDSYEKTFRDGETFDQRVQSLQDQQQGLQDLLDDDED